MASLAAASRGRLRAARDRLVEVAARAAGVVGRGLPGVAGPLLVSHGAWLAWPPLGWVALGVFALLLDRRVP